MYVYRVIDDSVRFAMGDETIEVVAGNVITIQPTATFIYIGCMTLAFSMELNFQVENDGFVRVVSEEEYIVKSRQV